MTSLGSRGTTAGRPHPTLLLLLLPPLLAVSLQTGRYGAGLLILAAAVLSYRLTFRIASTYGTRTIASLVLLGGAYLLAQGTSRLLPSIFPPLLIHTGALWLALVAGATWYGMGEVFGPWWLVMVTGLSLTLAGNTRPSWPYTVCVWSWILAVLFFLVWHRSPLLGRRAGSAPPLARYTFPLLGALVLASLVYIGFDLFVHRLEIWLIRLIDLSTVPGDTLQDLSAGVDLRSDMPAKLSPRVALRVTGSRPPDHLRGNVLLTYRNGHWFNNWSHFRPAPRPGEDWQRSPPVVRFALREPQATVSLGAPPRRLDAWWHLRVQPVLPTNGVLFTPAGTRLVAVPGGVRVDEWGVARKPTPDFTPAYDVVGTEPTVIQAPPLSPREAQLNLAVPTDLLPQLRALAMTWTTGVSGNRARAAAIERYFRTHFEYSLQVRIPLGVDPILYFLENRPPAYCAYFASGMTLLLRALGIPAHVVTGYLSAEYHPFDRSFVVRERQAHGWVEVYQPPAGGWIPFDPTPSAPAVVEAAPPSRLALAWEYLRWRLADGWTVFRAADLRGKLALVGRALDTFIRWPGTWLVLLLVAGIHRWRRRGAGTRSVARPIARGTVPPGLAPLRSRLEEVLRQHRVPVTGESTCEDWLVVLAGADLPADRRSRLIEIVRAYRRARFDPAAGAEARHVAERCLDGLLGSKRKEMNTPDQRGTT